MAGGVICSTQRGTGTLSREACKGMFTRNRQRPGGTYLLFTRSAGKELIQEGNGPASDKARLRVRDGSGKPAAMRHEIKHTRGLEAYSPAPCAAWGYATIFLITVLLSYKQPEDIGYLVNDKQ